MFGTSQNKNGSSKGKLIFVIKTSLQMGRSNKLKNSNRKKFMNKMGLEYQWLMDSFKEILCKLKIKQLLRLITFLTSKILLIINNQKMMKILSLVAQMIKINFKKNLYHLDLGGSVDNITKSKQLIS